MQWSLIAVIHILNALFYAFCTSAENGEGQISFGYFPKCVVSALTSCLSYSNNEILNDVFDDNEVPKYILQGLKSERGNSWSEIEAILLGLKSKLTHGYVPNLEVLLQEVMRELETLTNNSPPRDYAFPEVKKLRNCAELRAMEGESSGGVQAVYPYLPNQKEVVVYCDQVTDGGGWTTIQSRSPLRVRESFERPWQEYAEGFGDPKGEYWLGLDNIHALTSSTQMELRFDLEDWEGVKTWAKYGDFHVGDAASKYVLRIEDYSGDAGDGMNSPESSNWILNGTKFSTYDSDNDLDSERNCADLYRGGWWFNKCYAAYLNGLPFVGKTPNDGGIHWKPFREWNQLKKVSMKIRPIISAVGFRD